MLTSLTMRIRTGLLSCAVIVASLFLGTCDRATPPPEQSPGPAAKGTAASPGGEILAEYRESIHPDLPQFRFTLTGTKTVADQGTARVRSIEIRRDSEPDPFQVIDGVNAETPVERPGAFEAIDMNFDGYRDIRLIDSLPAGPNTPHRNWTYDPAEGSFQPSPELDRIPAAQYDGAAKTIRSEWRDGPAHYASDAYRYIDGKPLLARREERRYTEPGVYTLTVSERVGGTLRVVESRQVRE